MATPPPVAVSITCTPNKNDKQKSKTVGAYRIRPHVSENETNAQTNTAQNSIEQV